jgi:spore maturation protein CgeB
MRVCVLGKRGSVIGWVEGAVSAWRSAGHTVMHAVFRDTRLHPALEQAMFSRRLGAPWAAVLARRIRAFAPDLIVAIDAFSTPLSLLAILRDTPGLPPPVGWVGDRFGAYAIDWAAFFGAIAYTDTGLLGQHQRLGLPGTPLYLPHAANAMLEATGEPGGPRRTALTFVANPTPERLATVQALQERVVLHGPGWQRLRGPVHEVNPYRVPLGELGEIYRSHAGVLNMRNETHVLDGLNQRNFDPFLCGAVVATDPQPDLERCFDPGSEVLVWREPAEIDEISARLRREPAWAAAIAGRGRRRVLAEHTYAARLQALARLLSDRPLAQHPSAIGVQVRAVDIGAGVGT